MENQTERQAPANVENQVVATPSQRFTAKVLSEFGVATSQPVEFSASQKRLVQGYFIIIDKMLSTQEANRLAKNANNSNHQYDNNIPYDWSHVDMTSLALDAVHAARMGLDMQEEAHLYPIPYANKKKGCYDIVFMEGYAGKQYKAEKYALCPPKAVTIEVVYSKDKFKPIKKGRENPYDTYEFEIESPFDRGEIVGGFGYIEYDDPHKNELVIMNLEAIKKRAKKGSAEFWGTRITGKKVQSWENGSKTWVNSDGWEDEMVRKTIVREVYSKKHIPLDPSKLDDDYQHFKEREVIIAQAEIESESAENANSAPLDFEETPPEEAPAIPSTPAGVAITTNITQEQEIPVAAQTPQGVPVPTKIEEPDF